MKALRSRIALFALAWTPIVGCTPAHNAETSPTPSAEGNSVATETRWNYITAAELRSVVAVSTLDAVAKLRPEFLRASARAATLGDPGTPSLYINRTYIGDASFLAMVPIAEIRDIAFLHPAEARMQFGSSCPCGAGVVLVQTEPRTR